MEKLRELTILEGKLNEKRYEVMMEQLKAIEETQKTILLVLSTMVKEPKIKNAIRRVVDYDPIEEAKKIAEREVAAESKPYGDDILKPENRDDYVPWAIASMDSEYYITTRSSNTNVLDDTSSDKITIYCHNEQEFIDFTEWMYEKFRVYGTMPMSDILDKIGFSDAEVDQDFDVTDSMVFIYKDEQKVVINKNN